VFDGFVVYNIEWCNRVLNTLLHHSIL
jgi:hypothetical protein